MIAVLAAACLGAGIAIGYTLVRRFWLRAWVGLWLVCAALTLASVLGLLPRDIALESVAAAVLLFLVPPPLGAGLIVGGVLALFVKRHSKTS